MTRLLKGFSAITCALVLALGAAMLAHTQTSPTSDLREQLRSRFDIVALQDGLALVPRQRNQNIRLVEVRNGAVAINGETVSAQEARQRLGQDADLILRATYLDAAAQRDIAGRDSSPSSGVEPQSAPLARTQTHRGDLVRIGGGVTVGRDELVEGKVVDIGGSADVDGEVTRDVTVIGGSLDLGPDAVVRGDVAVIGGSLNRSPGARIDGKVDNVSFGAPFPFGRRFQRDATFRRPFARFGSFTGTLLRATLLMLGAMVIVALGGRFVETIADRAATEPLRSGLAGLLAEVLFVPLLVITVVVLAVSIIGIPLLLLVPFAVVMAVLLMLIGFTGIAFLLGRRVSNRFGIGRGPYASVALGVLLVVVITLIAKLIALGGGLLFGTIVAGPLAAIGYLAEYIAWTTGMGALILTWLSTRHRSAPAATGATPPSGAPIIEPH